MSKQVILRLNRSLLGSYEVIAEIGKKGVMHDEIQACLPALPIDINHTLRKWRDSFRRLNYSRRLKVLSVNTESILPDSILGCESSETQFNQLSNLLTDQMQTWLRAKEFQKVLSRMKEVLSLNDEIQIIIRTDDDLIFRLPWHHWEFPKQYHLTEISFSTSSHSYSLVRNQDLKPLQSLKILAIFGDDIGINLRRDESLLDSNIPNGSDIFLKKLHRPSKEKLGEELRENMWDILFFSGHSESQQGKGILYLEGSRSIYLDELKDDLETAIHKGLKLAVFNSCDGLELAKYLQNLQLPQVVVMREPIPDEIAHDFLAAYIEGILKLSPETPLYLATRYAREKLAQNSRVPCADWLPVVFQNHKVLSPVRGIISNSYKREKKRIEKKQPLAISFEPKPKVCRVINTLTKNTVGRVQVDGVVWRAQIFSNDYNSGKEETISAGASALMVARRGNLCLVLPKSEEFQNYSPAKSQKKFFQTFLDLMPRKITLTSDSIIHLIFFGISCALMILSVTLFRSILSQPTTTNGNRQIFVSKVSFWTPNKTLQSDVLSI
ncbi:MAG: hypothetical protein F6J95_000345 [Leptolyngbya sp. SIO1E4]|nr:hypothetical protein [Leptolyngbya sp. SIO1E4]